jgi:hypothetical protein
MKKLLMVAICFAASGIMYAQTVQFGVKAGVNVADLKDEADVDYKSRASFNAGALAHIHITRHFALQPEIYYSAQGGKFQGRVYRYNYLNIPLLLQYMTNGGFRLQTGPQLGVLLSAKDEEESDGESVDVKHALNDIDFAWSFGAGYLFPGTGLGIDARYNLGLTNIRESGPLFLKNRVISIGLFYQFMNTVKR